MTGSVQALEGTAALASNGWKPYPGYKDSGVAWLGRVPDTWQLPRLGARLSERNETNKQQSVTDVLSVLKGRGVIPYDEKGNIGNKKSEDITRYKVVRPNDIVVNCMNVIIGSVGLSKYTGCLSPVYYVLQTRSSEDNPRYLNAIFQTQPFQRSLVCLGNGILAHRMRIPMEKLKCELIPLPPPEEQDAIVRFLDYHDRLIRKYTRAKQKLISLLTEQKQAIIRHAVTRGLNPDVRLKPSGVDWLGEIPEHWEVLRLKRLCRVQGGYAFPAAAFGDQGVPVVRMNNLRRGVLELGAVTRIPESQCVPAFRLNPGDILYGLSGSVGATGSLGNFAVVRETDLPAMLNQRVARLVPDGSRLSSEYLVLVIQTAFFYEQVLANTTGTAQFNVSTNDLARVALGLPSIEEQEHIASFVKYDVVALDTAISRAEREIALMREYRTRLTADVVTGKLDVRDAAATLPPADDAPPIDDTDLDETTDAEESLDVAEAGGGGSEG
jgi:type I restriction enzyme, S subunit